MAGLRSRQTATAGRKSGQLARFASEQPRARAVSAQLLRHWPVAALLLAVLIFYWKPLTDTDAHIQWDAVDVHYSSQRYFAERLGQTHLPFWTPYIFAGFPFLADVQVGAWYPPNWPFFLAGITPQRIQDEIILHAMLACLGAYFLTLELVGDRHAAVIAALAYGLSGYFAGHSSHVGMFQTAAWLPWLLLAFVRALDRSATRWTSVGGLLGGVAVLAGHFQTALYLFAALALAGLNETVRVPRRAGRVIGVLVATTVLAIAVSAIQTAPGFELVTRSLRAGADYSTSQEGRLPPEAVLTLLVPNYLGALSGSYRGPWDRTEYYFYAGWLTLGLAAVGLWSRRTRALALWLLAPAIWYALGPSAGAYRLVALLPGFHSVRAPVHVWFVPALALALLAGAGAQIVGRRLGRAAQLALALLLLTDLTYWNAPPNRLAYSEKPFQSTYGAAEQSFRDAVAAHQPPLTRLYAPDAFMFGSLNHPLDLRLEATYGYNPLELSAYAEYVKEARTNSRLLNGLNVSRVLDLQRRTVISNAAVLPRAYFAREIAALPASTDSRTYLARLDPAAVTVIEGALPDLKQDPSATATIVQAGEQAYRIRYHCRSPSVMHVAVPYFPGWQATVDGAPCPVLRADHALIGVVVPPGERELRLRFRSNYFGIGAVISTLAVAAASLIAAWPRHRIR